MNQPATRQYKLTDEEETELHELFNLVDTNRSGTITINELIQLLHTLNIQCSISEVELICNEMDCNGDGNISFDEFVGVMNAKVNSIYTPEQILNAFHSLCNHPESIDISSLKSILLTYGSEKIKLNESQVDELISQLDIDSDGKFNYKQYVDSILS